MTTDIFNRPFTPDDNATSSVAITGTTNRAALKLSASRGGQMYNVRVFNDSSATAFIAFGNSAVTAAITDIPVGPGMVEVFTLPVDETDHNYIAGIGASGTIYASAGYGI